MPPQQQQPGRVEYRIFAEWDAGAFVNSEDAEFHRDFNQLCQQFGQPDKLEVRERTLVNGERHVLECPELN